MFEAHDSDEDGALKKRFTVRIFYVGWKNLPNNSRTFENRSVKRAVRRQNLTIYAKGWQSCEN
jgi:hypothetical protein